MKNTNNPVNQKRYGQIIGFLVYLTNRIRSDIADDLSRLISVTSNSSMIHWIALKKVFHYFKNTLSYQLSLAQVVKDLVLDTRDPSSKSSCFTFSAKFISKINESGSILPFSLKKKYSLLYS